MLPLAEVMDKMPLRGDVVVTTAVIALPLAIGAGWRPVLGTVVVLVAIHFLNWLGPSQWAMHESFDKYVGESMRKEDPEYFRLARSIPLIYLAGILAGTSVWVYRRKKRERAGSGTSEPVSH
jgi:hypothetical protein